MDAPEPLNLNVADTLQFLNEEGFRLGLRHRRLISEFLWTCGNASFSSSSKMIFLGFELDDPRGFNFPEFYLWEERHLNGKTCLCPIGRVADGNCTLYRTGPDPRIGRYLMLGDNGHLYVGIDDILEDYGEINEQCSPLLRLAEGKEPIARWEDPEMYAAESYPFREPTPLQRGEGIEGAGPFDITATLKFTN